MRKIQLNPKRQNQIHFNTKLNKKSNYLKNLVNVKDEGYKKIENDKVDILINECLGIDKFERDYSFFNPPIYGFQPSNEISEKSKLKLFPKLKVLITSPSEKDFPDRYKQKDYIEDDFSNIYKNSYRSSLDKNNKIYSYNYKQKNKNYNTLETDRNYFSRNGKNRGPSFLSGIGKHIFTYSIDKKPDDLSKQKRIINNISIK